MSATDRYYHRIVKGCKKEINKGETPKRKGTTPNPPVKKHVLAPGAHTCAFCHQRIFIPDSPKCRTMFNPDIGFVCLDCSKPKPREELTPPHHYYVKVQWGPFGLFTKVVPRHTLTQYGPCMGRGCTHIVPLPGNLCSVQCGYNMQRGTGYVTQRVNSNPEGFGARRGY